MKAKDKKWLGIVFTILILKILLDGLFLYVWDKTPADWLAEVLHHLF